MASSLHIFELIKSLSTTQIGYFKKLNKSDYKKKFVTLFELYHTCVKKESLHYGEKKISAYNQIDKDYLFEKILDTLVLTSADKDIRLQARNYISHAEALIDKALYQAAFTLIQKGQHHCKKYFLDKSHLELIDLELKVYFYLSQKSKRPLEKIEDEKTELIKQIQSIHESRVIEITQLALTQKKLEYKQQEFDKLLDVSIKKANALLHTTTVAPLGKVYLNNALTDMYNQKGDLSKCFDTMKNLLSVFDQYPKLLHHEPVKYTSAISNCSLIYSHLGEFDKAELVLEKMENVPFTSIRLQKSALIAKYSALFTLCFKTQQFKKSFLLSQQLETETQPIVNNVSFYFTAPVFFDAFKGCFYCSEYKKSLKWLYLIINADDSQSRKDYYEVALLCELIVHYELKNFQLIHSKLPSFVSRFDDKQNFHAFAQMLTHLFEEVKKTKFYDFTQLHTQLKHSNHTTISTYFDLIGWVEQKLKQ